MPLSPILIMAGGTGGHVYPALAVADYLREHGISLYWLGTRGGLESRVVPEKGYTLLTVDIAGVRGKGWRSWLMAPLRLLLAVVESLRLLKQYRPMVVLGMGGFVSAPGGIAAWILGVPLLIHEQNAIAGLSNRLLSRLARLVMQGFPGTFADGPAIRTTGNPVRADIGRLAPPQERFAARATQALHLLVLGGSQGSRALNTVVPRALAKLSDTVGIEVLHQTGSAHLDDARGAYRYSGLSNARVVPYIEDMAGAYAWADLVVCRAGALTIAELCVVGIAAILVPFPFAVDDHQTANARSLADAGGALLLPEPLLNEEALAQHLKALASNRGRLLEMARKCRAQGRPEATRMVGDACLEVAGA